MIWALIMWLCRQMIGDTSSAKNVRSLYWRTMRTYSSTNLFVSAIVSNWWRARPRCLKNIGTPPLTTQELSLRRLPCLNAPVRDHALWRCYWFGCSPFLDTFQISPHRTLNSTFSKTRRVASSSVISATNCLTSRVNLWAQHPASSIWNVWTALFHHQLPVEFRVQRHRRVGWDCIICVSFHSWTGA